MNATATIACGPQYMRALERANEVRLARAELKRRVPDLEQRTGNHYKDHELIHSLFSG